MTSLFSRRLRALSSGLLFLVIVAAGASPAVAHNSVGERSPAPGSVVSTSPLAVTINTSDVLLDLSGEGKGFVIVARDATGLYYGDGCVVLGERSMSGEVSLGNPGSYTIAYQFVSADGHSLADSYTIEFEPGPGHTSTPGQHSAPLCGGDAPADGSHGGSVGPGVTNPANAATSAAEPTTAAANLVPLVIGAIAVFSLGGAVVYSRRRKP